MLLILAPSTTLDETRPPQVAEYSQPLFLAEAAQLVAQLRGMDEAALGKLLGTSATLTAQNYARYQQWNPPFTPDSAKPAVFMFTGESYRGLAVQAWPTAVFTHQAQPRLRLLSGLYGVLRPLDLIQPYRLELKTKLANPTGTSLYPFWRAKVTAVLQQQLATIQSDILLNLASAEYSQLVEKGGIHGRVITCHFLEQRGGQLKNITTFAKQGRGMVARFVLENNITTLPHLTQFDLGGYRYNPDRSTPTELIFVRSEK